MRTVAIPSEPTVQYLGRAARLWRPLDVGWLQVIGAPPDAASVDLFCNVCPDLETRRVHLARHTVPGDADRPRRDVLAGQCWRCHTVFWYEAHR